MKMKIKFLNVLIVICCVSCSVTEICQKYNTFYKDNYNISANCSGIQGNARNEIFSAYLKDAEPIDSILIVIEQLDYSLNYRFKNSRTLFIKDFSFDKQYDYSLYRSKKERLKDYSSKYGKELGKPNLSTTNVIIRHIKQEGLKNIENLVVKNNGGVEGNTVITIFDKNLRINNGVNLKRQLQFSETFEMEDY